jgi:hypothetical protein
VDPESLEQEMLKLLPESLTGNRYVDKLVKVRKVSGDERYLHVEIQAQHQEEFARRVVEYNEKAADKHRHPVVSVAILLDDDTDWRPSAYEYFEWGYKKTVEFPLVKTADWRGREAELWDHPNVFALVVLAHLIGRRTGENKEREDEKLRLLLRLWERKLDGVEMERWYPILDWLMPLPREVEKRVLADLRTKTGETIMPFVTAADRWAREQARIEGRAEGRADGVRDSLVAVLTSRFKEEGASLAASLRADLSTEQFKAALVVAATTDDLDDVRRAVAKP